MSALILRLVIDALVGFAVAVLAARLLERLLRSARARAWVWCIPPAKLALIVLAGVPADAFVRTGASRWDLGSFQIGLGLDWFGPKLVAVLGAIRGGTQFHLSAGDATISVLSRHLPSAWPAWILASIVTISMLRVLRRLLQWRAFAHQRARQRVWWQARRGRALIYLTPDAQGAPFAGGVLRPYVCLPASSCSRLTPDQLDAVLAHELAHVARRDVLFSNVLRLGADLLWPLPGVGLLTRRVLAAIERAADRRAVAQGKDPLALASAMLALAASPPDVALGAAEASSLRERVQALAGLERQAWWHWALIVLGASLTLGAVILGDAG